MIGFISIIVSAAILWSNGAQAVKPNPTETYTGQQTLISPDQLYLYWKSDNEAITFELHLKNTSRWVMFGFRGASYSDVIVTWLNDDGIGHFSDRKLNSSSQMPMLDSVQNYVPSEAFKSDEYKVFKFKRNIKLNCNGNVNNEDIDLSAGSVNLIYAVGPTVDIMNIELVGPVTIQSSTANLLSGSTYQCVQKTVLQFTSTPTGYYLNMIDLMPNGQYRLYWNYTTTDIIAEIHVRTTGWVGFGFSPNGGMANSDIVMGWVSNGQANFTDRHAVGSSLPLVDKVQDYKLLSFAEKDGYTIFKFQRPIVLCNSEDRTIETGSPNVIFAYGTSDPAAGQDPAYHESFRGSAVVNLISSTNKDLPTDPADVEINECSINNVLMPYTETYYYVKMCKVPTSLTEKRHIFKFEIVFPEVNLQSMHHVLVYECPPSYNGTPSYTPGDESSKGSCRTITYGWAVGSTSIFYFPKDTGYPIGGDAGYKYFLLEIHYDNPNQKLGYIEKISMKQYMTKSLRKNELGTLTLGSNGVNAYGMAFPPGMDSLSLTTFCHNSCVRSKLGDKNITFVVALPHTHLTGVEIWTKIVRKGVDIGYLNYNKYYNFNYQNNLIIDPPVVVSKDDEFITMCRYKTTNRTAFTFGGESTREEMCFNFLMYYPRIPNFRTCVSDLYYQDVAYLYLNLTKTGEMKVNSSVLTDTENFGDYVVQAYSNVTITNNLKSMYTKFYDTNRVSLLCESEFITGPLERITPSNVYTEPSLCPVDNKNTATTSQFSIAILLLIQLVAFIFIKF